MTFGETLSIYFRNTFNSEIDSLKLEAYFKVGKKGDLSISELKKTQWSDPSAIRMFLFSNFGIGIDFVGAAQTILDINRFAKDWFESQEVEKGDAINKDVLVEGLSKFMVAIAFGSKLKLAIWSLDSAKELRVLEKPEDAHASMSPSRAKEFTKWFEESFSAKNLPRMEGFFKQGYGFNSVPSLASWLGLDKMENDLSGLLHEAGHSIPAEKVKGVSWDESCPCFYNPVSRKAIPVRVCENAVKLDVKKDGSAYNINTVPDAWEAWESRIAPALRPFWRVQLFSIFAPIGLRGRMSIWGRSPGGKGQSTIQNVISRHVGGQHALSFDQTAWGKGWKHGSSDAWNKTLLMTPDVKGEGVSLMRNSTFHQFTGSDPMTIEPKFGRIFTARTWGKVWVTSNEFPNVEVGAAHAMDRLALFEFGEMEPHILDRETAKNDGGEPILSDSGKPKLRPDFEERLSAQLMEYLAVCFKAFWDETMGMRSAPSTHPKAMLRRIVATCCSQAQAAVEYRFEDYFECGDNCEISYGELNFVLKAWCKNDASMSFQVPGFVKWAEALSISKGLAPVILEHRGGVHTVVGLQFRGNVGESRGKVMVTFPDGKETEVL